MAKTYGRKQRIAVDFRKRQINTESWALKYLQNSRASFYHNVSEEIA